MQPGVKASGGLSTGHNWPQAGEKVEEENAPSVTYAEGGEWIHVKIPGRRGGTGGGPRGFVTEFSNKSRQRIRRLFAKCDKREVVPGTILEATLTYPGKDYLVPRDPREWKRHLCVFRKRFIRRWGSRWAVWKLEFQRRGAAHYHLVVYVEKARPIDIWEFRAWLSRAWWETVGSGDADHQAAGTEASYAERWGKLGAYMCKYLGKEVPAAVDPETGEVINIGRFWGQWCAALAPIKETTVQVVNGSVWAVRRAVWRYTGLASRAWRVGVQAFVPWEVSQRLCQWQN